MCPDQFTALLFIKWGVFKAVLSSPRVAKPTSKCAAAWWSPPCVWASSAPPSPWWEWSAPRSAARRPPKPDWPPCQASTSFSAVNKPDVLLNPLGFVFFPPSLCMVQFTRALIKAQLVELKGIHWGAIQRKKFKVCFQYSKDKVLKQHFNLLIRAPCACGALNVDQLRGFCHLTPDFTACVRAMGDKVGRQQTGADIVRKICPQTHRAFK